MDLKEPKKKKRTKHELKSSLPLVFGRNGKLTVFNANLSAVGANIIDPTEMEMLYTMGFFGKGSLSKSYPCFGRSFHGAPPLISTRQLQRRQEWMNDVKKLSNESDFKNDKLEHIPIDHNNELNINSGEKNGTSDELPVSETSNLQENKSEDLDELYTDQSSNVQQEENNITDKLPVDETCNIQQKKNKVTNKLPAEIQISQELDNNDRLKTEDRIMKEIEIVNPTEKENSVTPMEVDEVVLDSTEEEDVCEISEKDDSNYSQEESCYLNNEENNAQKNVSEFQGQLLVLPDSDSDTEDYLTNIKPEIKSESFPVRETLHLTFEESFFLMYGLGCLRLVDFEGKCLNIRDTWNHFCKEQKNFLPKYIVYHYFRSSGWVVKPGLKYGGDYLLYKEGPPFYHSSYIVIIDVLDAVTLKRIEEKSLRKLSWMNLIGLKRMAESASKEILIAQVMWPSSLPLDIIPSSPEVLSQFTVREMLWNRWKLNKNIDPIDIQSNSDDESEDNDVIDL